MPEKETRPPSEGAEKEKIIPEKELDPEFVQELKNIGQVVGGDFGMEIEIGKPGSGNFFNPETGRITLDPEPIAAQEKYMPRYLVGHEGGHKAIESNNLEILKLKKEKAKELFSQTGFAYLNNIIEDAADNSWVAKKFEGLKGDVKKFYEKQFKEENALMTTSETAAMVQLLGYEPKFVQCGSEIFRFCAQGRFSKKLDPDVEETLQKTIKFCEKAYQTIPGLQRDKKEIAKALRKRFLINYKEIWPEFKKLVEKDKLDEKLRQMIEQAIKNGDFKKAQEGGRGISIPMEKLPKRLQKELRKKLEEAEKKRQEDEKKAAPEEKETLKKGKDRVSVPMDKLSGGLKKRLKKIFEGLAPESKRKLSEGSKKSLQDLEDKLNKNLEGKLVKEKPGSHGERRIRQEKEEKEKEEKAKRQEEMERVKEELERMKEEEMSEYDKYYREVAPLIEDLYVRLRNVFIPKRHPRWKKGYPTGGRLDVEKLMQYEADKTKWKELWQRKTVPSKMDYRFSLLMDMSGSMRGEKRTESFKGLITLSEVLNRFGIKHEIIGFTNSFKDNVKVYKKFDRDLDDKLRDRIGKIIHEGGGNTPTGSATRFTSRRLKGFQGKDNFLVTFTDGNPEGPGEPQDAQRAVEEVKRTNQKLVGVGLGPDTEYVKSLYPAHRVLPDAKKFPEEFTNLLEDMIKYPEKY